MIRSLARLFVSDVEDKPWFNDREMWPRYLTMLATQRYNRFNLGFGIGYDFLTNVKDAYFLFAYPFLLNVPGYSVKAAGLPDAERDRNLETLQFLGRETVARGMQFQLGLWMHGYEWLKSPTPNYTIEGLHQGKSRTLLAFLVKIPIPFILITALCLGWLAVGAFRGRRLSTAFLLGPIVFYTAVSMSSQINIGIRHLLPIFPFLFHRRRRASTVPPRQAVQTAFGSRSARPLPDSCIAGPSRRSARVFQRAGWWLGERLALSGRIKYRRGAEFPETGRVRA